MQALLNPNLTSNRLHLGCGLTAPDDWLNVDGSLQVLFAQRPKLKQALVSVGLYPRSQAAIPLPTNILRLDLRKRLPFPDECFVAVYSSHTFVTNPPCQQGRLPGLMEIEAPSRVLEGAGVVAEGVKL